MRESESERDEDDDEEGRTFDNDGGHAPDDRGGCTSDIPMETPMWDSDPTDPGPPGPPGDKPRQSESTNAAPQWSQ